MSNLTHLLETPFIARKVLRSMLPPLLHREGISSGSRRWDACLADEDALAFLQRVELTYRDDLDRLRKAVQTCGAGEAFDALLANRQVRTVWGRLAMPRELRRDPGASPLAALLTDPQENRATMPDGMPMPSELLAASPDGAGGGDALSRLGCASPTWVAARLWDRLEWGPSNRDERLRWWCDRWRALSWPLLLPTVAWSEAEADEFRRAVLRALSGGGLLEWDGFHLWRDAVARSAPQGFWIGRNDPPPLGFAARWLWLDDVGGDHGAIQSMDACSDLTGVAGLLFADCANADHGPALMAFGRTLDIATNRPELLADVVLRLRRSPEILADMLLRADTLPAACLITVNWRLPQDPSLPKRAIMRSRIDRSEAFRTAVELLGGERRPFSGASAEDVAEILLALEGRRWNRLRPEARDRNEMAEALRLAVAAWDADRSQAVCTQLAARCETAGMACVAALTKLAAARGGMADTEAGQVVTCYLDRLSAGEFGLSVAAVSPAAAAVLCDCALRSQEELKGRFLGNRAADPALAEALSRERNPYSRCDTLATSIRAHFRILCRATAYYGRPPAEIAEALERTAAELVGKGSDEQPLEAVAPRHDRPLSTPPDDEPLVSDVSSALSVLDPALGRSLMELLLRSDEPAFVAGLARIAPSSYTELARDRLTALTPDVSGGLMYVTEQQDRIGALLDAGEADAAERFLRTLPDSSRLTEIPGAVAARVRAELRLLCARRDWKAVEQFQLPDALRQPSLQEAQDAIMFYRGIAALNRPDGATVAGHLFGKLHERHRSNPSYMCNLVAARVIWLLREDAFGRLIGDAVVEARVVLAQAEAFQASEAMQERDRAGLAYNRSLLLLAIGEPVAASRILTQLGVGGRSEFVDAALAVALGRQGRLEEALGILATAEWAHGRRPVLVAAKELVENGSGPRISGESMVWSEVLELAPAVLRVANLSPSEQAVLYKGGSRPLHDLVVDRVRAAAAGLSELVPNMTKLGLVEREDDLTAVLRLALQSSVGQFDWVVRDQPRGGFTAAGNPGERDLVVSKGFATIAILEAVYCRRPLSQQWMRDDLHSHYLKLLAYGQCETFSLVVYGLAAGPDEILEYMRSVATRDLPDGYEFLGFERLPDGTPSGFAVRLSVGKRKLRIVVIAVDLVQQAQRVAAVAANAKSPRPRKAGRSPSTRQKAARKSPAPDKR